RLPSFAPPPECIIRYEQLGFYRILLELKKNSSIVDYCYKNIEVLIDYDQKHSANLLKTLKSYFINNNNLTKTASDLYIHKNTLSYRLSLIKTLLGTDFSNSLEQMELFISVLLYDT
ncbi:MAG: helix-turn-helix domain-containing protein, partial [Lachnospiraceae bacterium]|nr:helix-turn-helix domain-containing protein [Lachnospiraceae bacterium]